MGEVYKAEDLKLGRIVAVKLLDFGIAKRIGVTVREGILDAKTETQLTETGQVAGTVGYMSPEQTRGEELDNRTDIFSLGCVLYEAATGRMPFDGPNLLAILQQIAIANPPKPTSIRPDLPYEFDSIIMRAIAKGKEDRYSSAAEFHRALESLRSGNAAHLRFSFPSLRHSLRTPLIVTLLLSIVVVILVGVWKWIGVPKHQAIHSIAVLPFTNTNGDSKMDYLTGALGSHTRYREKTGKRKTSSRT